MKLSLSVRVAETASKRDATHTFVQLTELAAGLGYEAVCMRASQVGIHSPFRADYRRAETGSITQFKSLHGHRRLSGAT